MDITTQHNNNPKNQSNNNTENQNDNITTKNENIFYIDAHTHLLDYQRQSLLNLNKVIKQAERQGIKYVVCNTTCRKQFNEMERVYLENRIRGGEQKGQMNKDKDKAENDKQNYLQIIPSFGIHPCYISQEINRLKLQKQNKSQSQKAQYQQITKQSQQTQQYTQQYSWLEQLKKYIQKYPSSTIGQIGLDFRKDILQQNPKNLQWQYFQAQFQLGLQLNKPMTIHCIRAYGELLKYLKKVNQKLQIKIKNAKNDKQTKKKNNKKKKKLQGQQQVTANNTQDKIKIKQQPLQQQQQMTIKQPPHIILHSYGGSKQITRSLLKLQNLQIYFSISLKHSMNDLFEQKQRVNIEKKQNQKNQSYNNDKVNIQHQHIQQLSHEYQSPYTPIIPLNRVLFQTDSPYQQNYQILLQSSLLSKQQIKQLLQEYKKLENKQKQISNSNNNNNLLKQCKYFNKFILNNKPNYVIANYKVFFEKYKGLVGKDKLNSINNVKNKRMKQNILFEQFCKQINKNTMRAFKIIMK